LPICFLSTKSCSGILRHCAPEDMVHILSATLCRGILLAFISFAGRILNAPEFLMIPYSVIVIHTLLVSISLIGTRVLVKLTFQNWLNRTKNPQKIMIYGAGWKGKITISTLLMDTTLNNKVVGFIDDNASVRDKYITGSPNYSPQKAFEKIIPEQHVTEIVIAIDNNRISSERKREITDECLKLNLKIKEVPPVKN